MRGGTWDFLDTIFTTACESTITWKKKVYLEKKDYCMLYLCVLLDSSLRANENLEEAWGKTGKGMTKWQESPCRPPELSLWHQLLGMCVCLEQLWANSRTQTLSSYKMQVASPGRKCPLEIMWNSPKLNRTFTTRTTWKAICRVVLMKLKGFVSVDRSRKSGPPGFSSKKPQCSGTRISTLLNVGRLTLTLQLFLMIMLQQEM